VNFPSAKNYEASAQRQLTPLIDVVFLLLIFFMVSTTFTPENRQLKAGNYCPRPPREQIDSSDAQQDRGLIISASGRESRLTHGPGGHVTDSLRPPLPA